MLATESPTIETSALMIDPANKAGHSPIDPQRETVLRNLLDGPTRGERLNYESAINLGLVDMFYYDPKTGYDGLVHTLSGELLKGDEGAQVPANPQGFHHEPSGTFGPEEAPSFVDREHLKSKTSKQKSNYTERPYEPYQAKVSIAGLKKMTLETNPTTNETELAEVRNNMFPKEYDALTVLQAIRIAKQGRDKSKDTLAENGKLVNEGYAPMIDAKSVMKIRLVMDPVDEKIIVAYPKVKFRGIMKLSATALEHFEQVGDI
ncbi:MAG TPA: hypothetical protein VFN51_02490 [Candidatus Saccharimonadales bacterium]|nr:hypothetical protein [Candidatus Saccharimonadales bacterium]